MPASGVRRTVAEHRDWFRATLEQLLAASGADRTRASGRAQLVLLRDAAMVGGYLDGWDQVRPAFIDAARHAAGLD